MAAMSFIATASLLEDGASLCYLYHSENRNSVVVIPELISTNFLSRRRSNQGFLDGTICKSSQHLPWIRCNYLFAAWFLRSVSLRIASIWGKLRQSFFGRFRVYYSSSLRCYYGFSFKKY
ncbi:hypothetical protein P3X46_013693 [Hevea brasiliensis]|uniref:Secreted protein n=1 Tax=Hevea brasiliensis TaxID=3981 RepID=A0ABQ9M4B3_HEVBR|nr:hypothetical protein P3X46_013693 [Hevea brasiliensis]